MKSSEFRHITDELLSAYLDNAVSEQERALVEAAVIAEPDIAWRLDSLRQTVHLLRSLPELALPRSFALQEAQLGEALIAPRSAPAGNMHRGSSQSPSGGFWVEFREGWRALWQAGNPVLRNAAAASFVLLLVLVGGASMVETSSPEGAVQVASAPAPAMSAAQPAQEQAMVKVSPAAATGTVETLATADEAPADENAPAAAAAQPNAKIAPASEAAAAAADSTESIESEEVEQPAAEMAAAEMAVEESAPAAASAPSAVEESLEADMADASAATMRQSDAPAEAGSQEAQPQGAEPLLTPVAPLPDPALPGASLARGMGGGGDGAASGGPGAGAGAGGDMPYPGGGEGLLPPAAYDASPDFVPAEPPGVVSSQEAATPTPQATAVAILPPAEPTATPLPVEAGEETSGESSAGSDEIAAAEVVTGGNEVASQTGYGIAFTRTGLLRMAQLGLGLITLMLVSLWWRSRGDSAGG